jgi:DNA-binding response OmpR family regulator
MHAIYIDDDATNRSVVKHMLCRSGIRVDEAADVPTGLLMVSEGEYRVGLIDLRIPGMNGVTGIRQLRARRDGKERVPIIVVSGDMSAGVRELCSQAGASDFLEKPVKLQHLLAKVGAAIGTASDLMLD